MKKLLSLAFGFGLVFTVAGIATAAGTPADWPAGTAGNGIGISRHNVGAYGAHFIADNSDGNGGTTEVCVFCHTPHHGNTSAPLWNKGLPTAAYTSYGTTVGGTVIDANDCGISLACLSCHDGVGTFDTLINAPGKGNNGSNNKTSTNFKWTFTEDGNTVNDIMTSTRLNIGTDLRDDHPVCVPYYEDRASLRPSTTTISDVDLTLPGQTTNVETSSATTIENRWVVKGYVQPNTGGASIRDLLRGAGANQVECSSCHDPHFDNKSWDEVESTWGGSADSDGLFLRRVGGNSLSGVCRTCHNK